MRNGIVLFTSDRGITPARLAVAAEERGFDTIYVPEHTHIPVRRDALHPTGGEDLPDDRYLRTLDPWVSLATCAAVTPALLGTDPDVERLRLKIGGEFLSRFEAAMGEQADAGVLEVLVLTFSGALLQAGMGLMTYDQIAERLVTAVDVIMRGN